MKPFAMEEEPAVVSPIFLGGLSRDTKTVRILMHTLYHLTFKIYY